MGAAILDHLWQSTLFALAAWALTIALRRYSARTRYWIWLAASVKFLIPFSALAALGLRLRPSGSVAIGLLPEPLVSATLRIAEPASVARSMDALSGAGIGWPVAILWASGFAIVAARWLTCWLRARSLVRSAMPHPMNADIEVRVSTALADPGVFGIRRPILLLPSAVISRLSPAELDAVVAHELCHARNRDNLAAAVHMLVESVFWCHPLVWWIGRRLLEERERACDEAVIELGFAPRIYAEGILKACRLSLESRLGVVAAASGSNLKDRLEAIVVRRPVKKLSRIGHAGLVAIASAALLVPVLSAVATPRAGSASDASGLAGPHRFDSASIEPTPAAHRGDSRLILSATRLSMRNTSLRRLISVAYGLHERQVLGGPAWLDQRYDIEATAASSIDRRMIVELLAERFGLRFIERNLGGSGQDSR